MWRGRWQQAQAFLSRVQSKAVAAIPMQQVEEPPIFQRGASSIDKCLMINV